MRSGMEDYARAFAITHRFALRAQSETFRLTCSCVRSGPQGWHYCISFSRSGATITFEKRKNVRGQSKVEPRCCCHISKGVWGPCARRGAVADAECRSTSSSADCRRPLLRLASVSRARQVLQGLSAGLDMGKVTWHGFRRGSATDLVARGASRTKVLAWGAWRSAAFLRYVSSDALNKRQALDVTLAASDTEGEGR